MSASMAEVLAEHESPLSRGLGHGWECNGCGAVMSRYEDFAAHQAEQLAANGYGKLEDARPLSRRQSSRAVGELIQAAKAKAWDQGVDAGRKYPANAKAKNPYRRPE